MVFSTRESRRNHNARGYSFEGNLNYVGSGGVRKGRRGKEKGRTEMGGKKGAGGGGQRIGKRERRGVEGTNGGRRGKGGGGKMENRWKGEGSGGMRGSPFPPCTVALHSVQILWWKFILALICHKNNIPCASSKMTYTKQKILMKRNSLHETLHVHWRRISALCNG